MYTEATPQKKNDKARLLSPLQQPVPSGQCLEFWFYMYGQSMGSLLVYKKDTLGTTQVWKKFGDQGNAWQKARVTLKSTTNYQVS